MKGHLRERSPGHGPSLSMCATRQAQRKWHGFPARSAMLKQRTPIEFADASHGRPNQL